MADGDTITIDGGRTALIIQDLQNDVVSDGGKFAATGSSEHAAKQNVVANVARLAEAARASGLPVIHVHYIVEKGARGLKLNAPIFQGIHSGGAVERGSWGAAAAAGLEPHDDDYLVEKTRMNAFYDTKLDILLRGLGIETVIITGAWTNMSIEHTARHGADAGYEVIVVSDGTSTLSDAWQEAALNYALTNIATVTTVDSLVTAIAGA
jgi:nicotinamidase-related amidase